MGLAFRFRGIPLAPASPLRIEPTIHHEKTDKPLTENTANRMLPRMLLIFQPTYAS
jgi:hypothetical protein